MDNVSNLPGSGSPKPNNLEQGPELSDGSDLSGLDSYDSGEDTCEKPKNFEDYSSSGS